MDRASLVPALQNIATQLRIDSIRSTSEAGSGNVVGIAVGSLTAVSRATGSDTDAGTSNGIGLAATQVDVHERLVVIDTSEDRNQPLVLINPEIVWASEEVQVNDEGCLSVPGIYDGVERPASLRGYSEGRLLEDALRDAHFAHYAGG